MSKIEERLLNYEPIQEILEEMDRTQREAEAKRIKKDPAANKLTRLFPKGKMNYNYITCAPLPGDDAVEIRFCWSCWKNQAGYFLSWVERIEEGERGRFGERREWQAHKTRKHAAHMAEWKSDRHDEHATA